MPQVCAAGEAAGAGRAVARAVASREKRRLGVAQEPRQARRRLLQRDARIQVQRSQGAYAVCLLAQPHTLC